MGRQEDKLKRGIEPLLEPGEELLAACIVAPRGFTKGVVAAGVAGAPASMGQGEQQRAGAAAAGAGLGLAAPMGLAVTSQRLLTIGISQPIGLGVGGKVRELIGAVPVSAVDSIEVKKIALRRNIVVTVGGTPIELEANAAASIDALIEGLARAKSA